MAVLGRSWPVLGLLASWPECARLFDPPWPRAKRAVISVKVVPGMGSVGVSQKCQMSLRAPAVARSLGPSLTPLGTPFWDPFWTPLDPKTRARAGDPEKRCTKPGQNLLENAGYFGKRPKLRKAEQLLSKSGALPQARHQISELTAGLKKDRFSLLSSDHFAVLVNRPFSCPSIFSRGTWSGPSSSRTSMGQHIPAYSTLVRHRKLRF